MTWLLAIGLLVILARWWNETLALVIGASRGWRTHRRTVEEWRDSPVSAVAQRPLTIILPVRDPEEVALSIATVRSIRASDFPRVEVVVVAASQEVDLEDLVSEFDLEWLHALPRQDVPAHLWSREARSSGRPEVRVVPCPAQDLVQLLNVGVNAAKYPVLAVAFPGLVLAKRAASRLGSSLDRSRSCVAVLCPARRASCRELRESATEVWRRWWLYRDQISDPDRPAAHQSLLMVRREDVVGIGGFRGRGRASAVITDLLTRLRAERGRGEERYETVLSEALVHWTRSTLPGRRRVEGALGLLRGPRRIALSAAEWATWLVAGGAVALGAVGAPTLLTLATVSLVIPFLLLLVMLVWDELHFVPGTDARQLARLVRGAFLASVERPWVELRHGMIPR